MVELSKEVKYVFYIDLIVAIIYTIQYLVLTDILFAGGTYYNPHYMRVIGGTVLAFAIGGVIALKRGELEKLKPVWELVIIWWIIVLILDIASLTYMPYASMEIVRTWITIIVLIGLVVVNTILYNRAG